MYPGGVQTDVVVLPVDAHTTAFDRSSRAFEMARVIPRSLNDAVGFAPSYLRWTSHPVSAESWSSGNVYLRAHCAYEGTDEATSTGPHIDFHGLFPYENLYDGLRGCYVRSVLCKMWGKQALT